MAKGQAEEPKHLSAQRRPPALPGGPAKHFQVSGCPLSSLSCFALGSPQSQLHPQQRQRESAGSHIATSFPNSQCRVAVAQCQTVVGWSHRSLSWDCKINQTTGGTFLLYVYCNLINLGNMLCLNLSTLLKYELKHPGDRKDHKKNIVGLWWTVWRSYRWKYIKNFIFKKVKI